MIGWHEVDFHHLREGRRYSVRCCPIGNRDERLLVECKWKEWENGDGPFTEGVWEAGERECFLQLRAKLSELESGLESPNSGSVLAHLFAAELRIKKLEEEIEAMRVTDPTELAAQLLNMKSLVDSAKNLSEPVLHLLWEEGDGSVQPFIDELKAWKAQEQEVVPLDIKSTGASEVFLPDDSEPLSEPAPPRVQRSEPGGYDAPEPKKGRS